MKKLIGLIVMLTLFVSCEQDLPDVPEKNERFELVKSELTKDGWKEVITYSKPEVIGLNMETTMLVDTAQYKHRVCELLKEHLGASEFNIKTGEIKLRPGTYLMIDSKCTGDIFRADVYFKEGYLYLRCYRKLK